MPRLFAVTRSRGPAWNQSLPLEQKDDWPAHAAFMNALHAEGFVLFGGPLEGTSDVLLIVRTTQTKSLLVSPSIVGPARTFCRSSRLRLAQSASAP